jgi:hypothetical protein
MVEPSKIKVKVNGKLFTRCAFNPKQTLKELREELKLELDALFMMEGGEKVEKQDEEDTTLEELLGEDGKEILLEKFI